MTEQIKSAIEALKLARDTRFFMPNTKVLDTAIRSLQAWEEVLQELEKHKITSNEAEDYFDSGLYCLGETRAYKNAIDIINRKLADIEE